MFFFMKLHMKSIIDCHGAKGKNKRKMRFMKLHMGSITDCHDAKGEIYAK